MQQVILTSLDTESTVNYVIRLKALIVGIGNVLVGVQPVC